MKDEIVLFTRKTCPKCKLYKVALTRMGVPFRDADCDGPDGLAEYCLRAGARTATPMLVVGGKVVDDVNGWIRDQHYGEVGAPQHQPQA